MGLVPDKGAVQELAPASADPAFDDRIHPGCLDAAEHRPDPVGLDFSIWSGPVLALLVVHEHHLRCLLIEYLRHYNTARPHRALGQLAPAQAETRPPEPIDLAEHQIRRKQVLGGLIHEYQIAA